MLAIKLRRTGKKHQAYFRLVVAEKRSKLDGRYVDDLGWLNPHTREYKLDKAGVEKWLKNGAKPTPTSHNLLVRAGVIKGPKIPVHAKSKKENKEEPVSKGQDMPEEKT